MEGASLKSSRHQDAGIVAGPRPLPLADVTLVGFINSKRIVGGVEAG